MTKLSRLGLMTIAACLWVAPAHHAVAQVTVGIGAPPICPYGYYEGTPYGCAPDGYYGPEWFSAGVFIGAGPWYRGGFYGRGGYGRGVVPVYRGPAYGGGRPVYRGPAYGGRGAVGGGFRGTIEGSLRGGNARSYGGGGRSGNAFHGGGGS